MTTRRPAAAVDGLARLLDALPEPMLLLDGDGRVRRANPAALGLLGPVQGQPLPALVIEDEATSRGWLQAARSGSAAHVLTLRRTGQPALPCRVEAGPLADPDGTATAGASPDWLWLRLRPQPEAPVADDAVGALTSRLDALAEEVERRRAVEGEAQRQREWLQVLLRSIGDAVIATDKQARIVFMNPVAERLTGWTSAEAEGAAVEDVFVIVNDQTRQPAASPVALVLDEGRIVGLEPHTLLISRDGVEWPIDDAGAPIVDDQCRTVGAVLVFREISERVQTERARRELELRLRDAQKMEALGTLAGGIAHDFNNVLGSMMANTGMASAALPVDHPAYAALQQVAKAGQRARELVRQILSFGRRQPQQLRRQPLQPLLDEAVALLRGTLPAAVQIDLAMTAEPVHALVDATQIEQVLLNLCTNAWHSLRGSTGRIQVSLAVRDVEAIGDLAPGFRHWRPGRQAVISVGDSGCGMDEATRQRIFEPFFTTKPRGQGTGLGLAVVHGIVAEHRGALGVSSRVGVGSTFTVYVPVVDGGDAEPTPLALPEQAAPDGEGRRVAYVDDDEVMLVTVEALLRQAGFAVTGFGSAAALLQALERDPGAFDIVVTDFNMPHTSGLELAQALRARRSGLPVVISSGYLSEDLRAGARELGVAQLLNKEDTFERIAAVIDEVLGGKVPPDA